MSASLRLTIELDPARDPVEGRLWRSDGDWRRFVGYLELLSALETLGHAETQQEAKEDPQR